MRHVILKFGSSFLRINVADLATGVQVLPTRVAAAAAKAGANTAQWIAFKARLDGQLGSFVPGAFEGSGIGWVADFALGYQCLKGVDDVSAARYADKAVALLTQLSTDYQENNDTSGWSYLARGDGVTTAFVLPDAPVSGTFLVSKVPVSVRTLVRGATPNTQDQLDADIYKFLKVSNTSDGSVDYAPGTDWSQAGQYRNDFIDWSPAGVEPASGATYYVTVANIGNCAHLTLSSGFTRVGTALTFSVAPTTSEAVVVQYMYPSGGNNYLQTSNGFGGFNSMFIDSSFPARTLAFIAQAYDWVYGYAGFGSGLKATIADLLVRWSDWTAGYSFSATTPTQPVASNLPYKPLGLDGFQSNYAAGYWFLRCSAAAALANRDAAGGRLATACNSYRASYLRRDWVDLPDGTSTHPFTSFKGGWDVEGWGDYAPGALRAWLMGGDTLRDAAIIPDAAIEATFAAEVIRCAIHSLVHPSLPAADSHGVGTMYPGGDFGIYPAGIPVRDVVGVWGAVTLDTQAKGYAARWVATLTSNLSISAIDLLYRDPTAATIDWTASEPLFYYAAGAGLVLSRADWSYATTLYSLECGNGAIAGHGTFCPGIVLAWRGRDDLIVPATEFTGSESITNKILHGNAVFVGTAGTNTANNGVAGTLVKTFEGTVAYTYAGCDYKGAYAGLSVIPTECTRACLHVRPDYLVVYDRATTTSSATAKQLQWYLSTAPTVTGDGWVTATKGTSRVFGHTYSATSLATAADTPSVAGTPVNRIKVNPASGVTSIRYATALQTAASGASAMDASAFVTSGDGKFEGILLGQVLVLFGNTKTSIGATGYQQDTPFSYTYTAPGGTLTHYLCDLVPLLNYTLSGSASGVVSASAAGVLSFTTTGSGSQTVTLNKVKNVVVDLGDSLTFGYGIVGSDGFATHGDTIPITLGMSQTYPAQAMALLGTTNWDGFNAGVDGDTIAQMTARLSAWVYVRRNANAARNVCSVLGGTNDLTPAGTAGPSIYSQLISLYAALIANGFEVIANAIPPLGGTNNAAHNTERDYVNAQLAANWVSLGLTQYNNAAATDGSSLIGQDTGSTTNTTYYQADQTHWTAAGAGIQAAGVAAKILASV